MRLTASRSPREPYAVDVACGQARQDTTTQVSSLDDHRMIVWKCVPSSSLMRIGDQHVDAFRIDCVLTCCGDITSEKHQLQLSTRMFKSAQARPLGSLRAPASEARRLSYSFERHHSPCRLQYAIVRRDVFSRSYRTYICDVSTCFLQPPSRFCPRPHAMSRVSRGRTRPDRH